MNFLIKFLVQINLVQNFVTQLLLFKVSGFSLHSNPSTTGSSNIINAFEQAIPLSNGNACLVI
jgi:hypothetical protein